MTVLSWRCVACDERFSAWAPAERHVDLVCGPGRLELVWPKRLCECPPHERLKDGEHPDVAIDVLGQFPHESHRPLGPHHCGSYWVLAVAAQHDGQKEYGRICLPGRRQAYAHRVAWELEHGEIPPGMFVCHSCDTPRCVNPAHLWLGTNSDNLKDAYAKGIITTESMARNARLGWSRRRAA